MYEFWLTATVPVVFDGLSLELFLARGDLTSRWHVSQLQRFDILQSRMTGHHWKITALHRDGQYAIPEARVQEVAGNLSELTDLINAERARRRLEPIGFFVPDGFQ